jgi:hypothetical protein
MPNEENIEERIKLIDGILDSFQNLRDDAFRNSTVGVIWAIHSSLEKHLGKLPKDISKIDVEVNYAFELLYKSYNPSIETLTGLRGELIAELRNYQQ